MFTSEKKKNMVFFFDLDGTITNEEILPKIAKELGFFDEMRLLTKLTLNGDIPFDVSFRLRVEILKQIKIEKIKSIIETVSVSREIAQFIQENQKLCCIVTNNLDVWVSDFCRELTPRFFASTAQIERGKIKGIQKIFRKADSLKEYRDCYTVAIGDSMNDAEILRLANFGIAYGGVHSIPKSLVEVAQAAVYSPEALCKLLNQLLFHARELALVLG